MQVDVYACATFTSSEHDMKQAFIDASVYMRYLFLGKIKGNNSKKYNSVFSKTWKVMEISQIFIKLCKIL